ncbi:MAG TPA: DHA2 family efflux MFS transporter permease subunit [Methylophaga aminisulfidivorans]|uniref:DHA2 family efflux MFS transporter permease subunit n=2 Tax=root TaxID=1 RepID=A0A7C1W686_9GAMM|nr:DHA2 family efflux MFS transporter permease subunit [Methylophaga aminisulfidivorans]
MTDSKQQPTQWLIVIAVVLTAVLEVLDTTIVNVALPHIQATFGITSDQTVWIVTSYIVASIAVMPLTGLLSRKFGRRKLIITAISGFALFSALAGMAQNFEMLVFFRLGQGFFGAFLIPLSQAILFTTFPREKRGQAMAIFGLGVVVAPVLGPTLGAILTEHFSWRAVFYVNMPLAFIALLMVAGELKKEEVHDVEIDWGGLVLMVLAIGALQMTLDLGESRDWFDSHVIQITALTSAIAGIIFFTRGVGRQVNIIDFSLLKDRSFAAGNIAIVGFSVAMFGAIAILPLFVQGFLDYPVLESGKLFIPRGIAAGLSMVITGAVLVNHFDQRVLLAIGLVLTGAGNIMLAMLNLEANFWQLAWPGIISGLGMGLFFVPMSTLAFQNISSNKQDEASGIYSVMRSLGSSIGIAIIGWQLARRINVHYAILSEQINPFNPAITSYLAPLHMSPFTSEGAKVLANEVLRQATMLAFQDAFLLSGIAAFVMLPIILLIEKPNQAKVKPTAAVH